MLFRSSDSCHGDEQEGGLSSLACWLSAPWQGSSEAALGSVSMVALGWPPSQMVEGRPLPPSSSATVLSDRRRMAINNLLVWRPLFFDAAGSRRLAPSGLVPGGDAFDYSGVCQHGGYGAGPDGVCIFFSRVYDAKCLDLVVIFYFFWSYFTLPPLLMEELAELGGAPSEDVDVASSISLSEKPRFNRTTRTLKLTTR